MLMNESLMTITFKIINVGTLIAMIVYVVKKYALPSIIEGVGLHEKTVRTLEGELTHKNERRKQLEEDIQRQQQEGQLLIENIKRWQETKQRNKEYLSAQYKERFDSLVKKRQKQIENFLHGNLEQEIAIQALKKARKQLEGEFADEQEARSFLESVIEKMKEGIK